MARWIMEGAPRSILDPACGLGIFYDEMTRITQDRKFQYTGYEIDGKILTYLEHDVEKTNLKVIHGDYLEADIGLYDGIICNPPYLRFQKFLKRHDILPRIERDTGRKLAGHSNIASVFLVKALNELSPGGSLAFIMPFEFFNTGYGEEIKKNLLEDHLLKQIVIFSNEREIFPDAITTVCVLLCKNDRKEEPIRITQIGGNDEIREISDISQYYQREISSTDLPCSKKWTPVIRSLLSGRETPDGFCELSMYGAFSRGIATGVNSFFSLSKSKIAELNIGNNNLCKCITKSRQVRKAIFTEDDFSRLHHADNPVYCLDVKDHGGRGVRDYILQGEKSGYHERYLTRMTKPWYQIEHRRPAPILFGVFNRGRLKVVRNYTTAISFTCFHSFHPNMSGERFTNKLFVYLFSDVGQEIIKANKRTYGDNLDKYEPGDLNDSLCPGQDQFDMIDDRDVEMIIEIAGTDEKKAIQMSNHMIGDIINAQQGKINPVMS
jgi:adenine-specific DNA-methyltransferase